MGEAQWTDTERTLASKRHREIQALFLELRPEDQASIIERAKAKTRHRGINDDFLGFGLAVMRARNEIIEMECFEAPQERPRSGRE